MRRVSSRNRNRPGYRLDCLPPVSNSHGITRKYTDKNPIRSVCPVHSKLLRASVSVMHFEIPSSLEPLVAVHAFCFLTLPSSAQILSSSGQGGGSPLYPSSETTA